MTWNISNVGAIAAFGLPGDGRVGFLLIGLLWAAALLAVSKASRS